MTFRRVDNLDSEGMVGMIAVGDHQTFLYTKYFYCGPHGYILTQTSNAKCFRSIIVINKRGLAEIIVPFRDYGRHSPNQVMNKRE